MSLLRWCVGVYVFSLRLIVSMSVFVSNFIAEIMQKLGHSFYRFDIIILFGYLLYCDQFVQCHRSDVYIAGFFPYGVGKENSETGECIFVVVVVVAVSLPLSLSCARFPFNSLKLRSVACTRYYNENTTN